MLHVQLYIEPQLLFLSLLHCKMQHYCKKLGMHHSSFYLIYLYIFQSWVCLVWMQNSIVYGMICELWWLVWQGCTVDRFFLYQTVTEIWTFTCESCCCGYFKDHLLIIHLEEDSYMYDNYWKHSDIKTNDFISKQQQYQTLSFMYTIILFLFY